VPLHAGSIDETHDEMTPRAGAPRSRRCLVTREVLPVEQLVRFAVAPDGTVVPDIAARLPGRGLWLSARRDIVRRACSGDFFAKAARGPVRPAPDLADHVERLLRRSCLDLIGLARRAGQAVAGFERTREWLQTKRAAVLVCGADAAADGREKLGRLGADVASVAVLSSDELGSVFGRERIMHAALGHGALAERFVREAARLAGFVVRPN
jgi:predicted RNA-binding protein YlxR (DUF448 family)